MWRRASALRHFLSAMEISIGKRRVHETVERAKRRAADRRARSDEAGTAYSRFLEATAVPLFRQIANVLRADGYLFNLSTPPGGVGTPGAPG